MNRHQILNYRILLFSNSLMYFAIGLFMPFWVIFVQDFGKSIESFGFAIGLMALAQSATAYFAGKYSDKFGRKVFLTISGFTMTALAIAYTMITTLIQLYALQVINGAVQAMQMTSETAILGDITKKVSRGRAIGRYQAITGILAALAMMGGGFLVGELGIDVIFYIVAGFFLISTIGLFYLKE